jgi:hypothetical protein
MTAGLPGVCPRCSGDGETTNPQDPQGAYFPCPDCSAGLIDTSGFGDYDVCSSCNGTGESGINRGPGYSCPCGACKGKGVTE